MLLLLLLSLFHFFFSLSDKENEMVHYFSGVMAGWDMFKSYSITLIDCFNKISIYFEAENEAFCNVITT